MGLKISKNHISDVFFLKTKQLHTYMEILEKKETNMRFRYIHSNSILVEQNQTG